MHLFVDEVAQTSDGTDVHSGVLYFLAQAVYVDFDGIGADIFVSGEDHLDQLIFTHNAPGAEQQGFQHSQFTRGEIHRLSIYRSPSADKIQRQRSVLDYRRRGVSSASQQRPYARFQLRQVEGFGEIVVRARVQAGDAIICAVSSGEDQYGRGGAAQSHASQYVQPVHAR